MVGMWREPLTVRTFALPYSKEQNHSTQNINSTDDA